MRMRTLGDEELGERPRGDDHSEDKHLPGYGGFVPGLYARNVFGATRGAGLSLVLWRVS